MHEKRLTTRVLNYWKRLRKNRTFPEIQHMNPAAIESLWSQCFLLKCGTLPGKLSYQYQFVGDRVIKFYERDVTGLYADNTLLENVHISLLPTLKEVTDKLMPEDGEGNFLKDNGDLVKYRMMVLPFGDDYGMTHILTGLSFKAIPK